MSLKASIGKVLRGIRLELGYSLDEISELTGKSKGNLSRLERAGAGCTIDTLELFCGVYKLKVSTLVKRAEKHRDECRKNNKGGNSKR